MKSNFLYTYNYNDVTFLIEYRFNKQNLIEIVSLIVFYKGYKIKIVNLITINNNEYIDISTLAKKMYNQLYCYLEDIIEENVTIGLHYQILEY